MLLRAAIVILVMLNLGAAGWWLFQPMPGGVAAASSAPGLRLLTEAEAAPATAPVGAATPSPAPASTLTPASPAATPAASPAGAPVTDAPATSAPATSAPATSATVRLPATAQAPVCLRFGPFPDPAARSAARAALAAAGVAATAYDERARGVRGWKVFLPAQPTREAAVATAERIKGAGVVDLFVMTEGADANSIALGRFSSETGARKRQAELRGKGVQAQVEPVGGTPAQAWLDARLPVTAERAALARIAASQPLDCARLR